MKDGDVASRKPQAGNGAPPPAEDLPASEQEQEQEPTDGELLDIEALIAERDSFQDQFQRARADYLNLRRRVEQDQTKARQQASRDILLHLLPVVDDLDRALTSVPSDEREQPWVVGVEMVSRKLMGVLERYGVKRLNSVGQPFDPQHHEAVATDDDGSHVVETYQEGYTLGGQTLRPAMVRTGKKPDNTGDGPG